MTSTCVYQCPLVTPAVPVSPVTKVLFRSPDRTRENDGREGAKRLEVEIVKKIKVYKIVFTRVRYY